MCNFSVVVNVILYENVTIVTARGRYWNMHRSTPDKIKNNYVRKKKKKYSVLRQDNALLVNRQKFISIRSQSYCLHLSVDYK